MAGFLHWLESYGYIGVAAGVLLESMGLPIPGETALLVGAFAAAKGSLQIGWVIVVAAAAGILGDNLGYLLGRRLGRGWIREHGQRFFFPSERLRKMERFFDRFGAAAVALARFVTGVRVVAAFAAGVSRLAWGKFLAFNILGAVVWAATIGGLGYAAGRGSSALGVQPWMFGAVIVGVIALVAAAAYLRRRAGEPLTRWVRESWLGRLLWREAWVLALSVSGLVLFAKVAEDVTQAESGAFDAAIRHWMLTHPYAPARTILGGLSWLGAPVVALPATLAVALWLWWRRRALAPAVVLIAALLGSALFLGLKAAFHGSYPATVPLGPTPHYSFPNGHATVITAVAATTAYILVRSGRLGWGVALAASLPVILVVGMARVYLDLAHATDVIGGWAVGLFVSAIAGTAYETLRDYRRSPPP